MKSRLILFAFALLAVVLIAYVFHSGERRSSESEMTTAASAPPPSEKSSPEVVASTNSGSPSTRSSASTKPAAGPSSPAANAPTTEAAALGYLQSTSKRSWDLKRDDFSNQIRTLSGGELESKSIVPREAADQFVKFYSRGLFGVDPAQVTFNREEVTDRTRLIYDQIVDGTPVYGGTLTLFFENGSLTRVQNDLAPYDVDSGSAPSPLSQAFSSYKAVQSSMYDVTLQDHASNRVVLYPNGRSLVYAYEFVTREADKGSSAAAKSYHVLYDAADSFVIQRRSSAIH